MHSRHKAASTKKRPAAFWVYEVSGLPHPIAELAATRKDYRPACTKATPAFAGFSGGKVWKSGDNVLNAFIEPQWTVERNGNGQPQFTLLAGLNVTFGK